MKYSITAPTTHGDYKLLGVFLRKAIFQDCKSCLSLKMFRLNAARSEFCFYEVLILSNPAHSHCKSELV